MNGIDDAFKNLGENIAEYLLQSMLVEDILKKYENEVNEIAAAYGNNDISYQEMANLYGELAGELKKDVENRGDAFNVLLSNIDEAFGGVFGDEDGSLGESIMSANLTEETGSLIASYINAIRADVSFSKSQRAQLVDMAGQILNSMIPAPKLDEYLQAIQANTLNAANAARDILSELRGVITSEGGASAFRTYM